MYYICCLSVFCDVFKVMGWSYRLLGAFEGFPDLLVESESASDRKASKARTYSSVSVSYSCSIILVALVCRLVAFSLPFCGF